MVEKTKPNPLAEFKATLSNPMDQYRFQIFWDYYRKSYKESKENDPVRKFTADQLISMWRRVRSLGLNFDGEQVYFDYRNGFGITYIGLKNVVLQKYPNAKFDINVVYNDDELTYHKTEEGVKYEYTPKDPFAFPKLDKNNCNVKGGFGYVRCNDESGTEVFITVTIESILEMEGMSRSKTNWVKWADQMILKSIIKRMTKQLRFDERIQQVMQLDNELEGADFDNPTEPHQTTFEDTEMILEEKPIIPDEVNDEEMQKVLEQVEVKDQGSN